VGHGVGYLRQDCRTPQAQRGHQSHFLNHSAVINPISSTTSTISALHHFLGCAGKFILYGLLCRQRALSMQSNMRLPFLPNQLSGLGNMRPNNASAAPFIEESTRTITVPSGVFMPWYPINCESVVSRCPIFRISQSDIFRSLLQSYSITKIEIEARLSDWRELKSTTAHTRRLPVDQVTEIIKRMRATQHAFSYLLGLDAGGARSCNRTAPPISSLPFHHQLCSNIFSPAHQRP
jgi:hypothetical protein